MNVVGPGDVSSAKGIFAAWLEDLAAAAERRDGAAFAALFAGEGHWKDILAFSWQHRTFSGRDRIRDAFAATAGDAKPRNVRLSAGRTAPRFQRRSGRDVIEGYFDFDTRVGRGSAFVRLLVDRRNPSPAKIWLLLTTLQELRGFEEKTGPRRPTGNEFAMNERGQSWREAREARCRFGDRDPEVVVIGAGQAGLALAARLGQMGVDALVLERLPRVGDNWRSRYESLTLHNETMANHLPYLPFPETWPLWLAKDQLADWLEAYARFLEINVWTASAVEGADYDPEAARWNLTVRVDGKPRRLRTGHVVLATGTSGGEPYVPAIEGLERFGGEVIHSSAFRHGGHYAGKSVLVVGTGNSGHDVAQDLVQRGASAVTMLQRGPTCVVSLDPTAAMVYKIYAEGLPTDDVDLMTAAIPYPVMEETYRWITKKGAQHDRELLDGLARVGFRTYFGSDDTGFQMMFMRGEGGYYIDVGCSRLIAEGRVGVMAAEDVETWTPTGLRLGDGGEAAFDAVVLATGYHNMQETVRRIFGDAVAERIGPVWGFDEHFQMRNMWRRTAQPGLWMTGGSLLDSRLYSRFLAIEIKAALENLLPAPDELPLRDFGL